MKKKKPSPTHLTPVVRQWDQVTKPTGMTTTDLGLCPQRLFDLNHFRKQKIQRCPSSPVSTSRTKQFNIYDKVSYRCKWEEREGVYESPSTKYSRFLCKLQNIQILESNYWKIIGQKTRRGHCPKADHIERGPLASLLIDKKLRFGSEIWYKPNRLEQAELAGMLRNRHQRQSRASATHGLI